MKKVVHINVGNCGLCREGTIKGEKFNPEKCHNCNTCGYYNSYNQEMIEYDTKTSVITFSSVTKAEVPHKSIMPEYINPSLNL